VSLLETRTAKVLDRATPTTIQTSIAWARDANKGI
jgi:hypothetical protein